MMLVTFLMLEIRHEHLKPVIKSFRQHKPSLTFVTNIEEAITSQF